MKENKLPKQLWMEGLMRTSLTHATKSVAWVIANRSYGHKTESNPSFDTIADEAGVHRKNVWRHIKELQEAGWIVKTQKLNHLQRPYNCYKMTTPQISVDEAQQQTAEQQDAPHQPQDAPTERTYAFAQPQDEGGISNKEVIEEVSEEVIKTEEVKGIDEEVASLLDSEALDARFEHKEVVEELSMSGGVLGNADWINPRQAQRNYKQSQKKKDFARWSK